MVVAATDLLYLVTLELGDHVELAQMGLLDTLETELAVQGAAGNMHVTMGCQQDTVGI